MRRPSTRASVLVGVLLLAGCGQGGAGTPSSPASAPTGAAAAASTTASSRPSPSSSPSPAPADAPTTSPAATALATESTGCDPSQTDLAPEIPNGAERVREAVGDLDGDDTPDRLVTWAVTLAEDETVFHLRVVTGPGPDGGCLHITLPDAFYSNQHDPAVCTVATSAEALVSTTSQAGKLVVETYDPNGDPMDVAFECAIYL